MRIFALRPYHPSGRRVDQLAPLPASSLPFRDEQPEAHAGAHPAGEALVVGASGDTLERVLLTRNQARSRYRIADGAVEVVLAARDDGAPAFARSASFNLFYAPPEGACDPRAIEALMQSVSVRVQERDRGQLTFDVRKGLTEVRR
jgi:hypothetical protein